jgi:hypothetical protein
LDIDNYVIGESDVTNAWSYNLYAPGMISTKTLMDKATATSSPYYSGVAKILMAYHLGVTTDHWGDIPYSNALQGATGTLKPTYDTQQTIYTTIFALLDGGIADLGAATSVYKPGAEDLIYGGDKSLWIKTAWALKARYNLHLSKKNGATAYTNALAAVANSYTSNSDDFKFVFGTDYSNSNPAYQFNQERAKYVAANSTYQSKLAATSDPRQAAYFTGTVGSAAGAANSSASAIGANYASTDSPVYLMSYAELKFIEAEARFNLNATDPLAVTAYNAGLKASLQREGVYGDGTWYTAHVITAGTISLQKIIEQKYLSGFLELETFTDWRRTGFPVLVKAAGAVTSEIPRRLPYPDDERLYNGANMPAGLTIINHVWWDL